ncbi:MAG: hypothetical protein ACJ76V_02585 [Thermoleophilaceae bacterium]
MRRPLLAATGLAVLALALPAGASAGVFGTDPLAISIDPAKGAPNGPSDHATVSGDDRSTRYAAFDSSATNLVSGDGNGVADVFLWSRPHGSAGLTLSRPTGDLQRVSVTSSGGEANGESTNPSLDGSIKKKPHCVAFQSTASNLASGDNDKTSDIFVRDFARNKTALISRGVGPAATDASIDGSCTNVAFTAGGKVLVASVKGGKPKSLGAGSQPDYSLDSTAVTWVKGGNVMLKRDGKTTKVGPGSHPTVSDSESQVWAVTFDTKSKLARNDNSSGSDVYMRVFSATGGVKKTDLISASRKGGSSLGGDSYNGGLTAYAANRGIVVFVNNHGGMSDLWYRNNHSGNIDDLAHGAAIANVATSARANFVAFSSNGDGGSAPRRDRSAPVYDDVPPPVDDVPPPSDDPYAGAAFTGDTGGVQSVFFKHLIDGSAI